VIKSLTYITTSYKEGYVPPGALSWSDAEGRAVGALEERVKCCSDLPGTGSEEQDWRSANCDAPWRNRAGAPPESFGSAKA
jgi:hypothetical protein